MKASEAYRPSLTIMSIIIFNILNGSHDEEKRLMVN
jgi:hypothetical protein